MQKAAHSPDKGAPRAIALMGNPNVGKSTLFNALTGMRQHTGNWPGKTVALAEGRYSYNNCEYTVTDLPGCYSLMAHSAEEEVARDHICSGTADLTMIVCDATCIERNMNLVLQTLEITGAAMVCVNLMDEAKKKGIALDLPLISGRLNVPVIGLSARAKGGVAPILPHIEAAMQKCPLPMRVKYPAYIEAAIAELMPLLPPIDGVCARYAALRLMDGTWRSIPALAAALDERAASAAESILSRLSPAACASAIADDIARALVSTAQYVCCGAVTRSQRAFSRDRRLDRLFAGRVTAFPIMLLLLALIFYITIVGANYPSAVLSSALFVLQDKLLALCAASAIPPWLYEPLILGVYRVLAWVVSVMLPPMAIFFPLFTLLEDLGYLPRVAFNLDKCFKRCNACGKQALTMCMGFGCNAVGVAGCRIIDSPRERLIAVITNSFVPCNGRFPTLIAIISMFFVGTGEGIGASVLPALLITAVILFGVCMTLIVSKLLSKTLLCGVVSSFALELPPYRAPQVGSVIVRSVLDRTMFVLGRAVAVAAPAGLIIWLMANLRVNGATLLALCAGFLDPFARLLGLDGVILMAFILGFPANEIVIPIMLMAYMSTGTLSDFSSLAELKLLLLQNGWSWSTAVSMLLFSLMHWPCSTTCLTIKKETQSLKWTLVSVLLPTLCGMLTCFLFNLGVRLFA